MANPTGLLAADEPSPVIEVKARESSSFVIVVDHAGSRIPRKLGTLGLAEADLQRHIGWDIGALDVALGVASALGAALIAQRYSRLVIDCNRDPIVPTSIPVVSEHTHIPGNAGLGEEDRNARRSAIFEPYHQRIRCVLDARRAAGQPTILVAQHTMTDVFKGVARPMHAAVLYNRDARFARLVRAALLREPDLVVADNEPYFVTDATDYSIPEHGEKRGIPHVEIEVRQDLVRDRKGQHAWVRRIATALQSAEQAFRATPATAG